MLLGLGRHQFSSPNARGQCVFALTLKILNGTTGLAAAARQPRHGRRSGRDPVKNLLRPLHVSGARETSEPVGPASWNRSQRGQFRGDTAKTFDQNVLMLNAHLVPDRPCLDPLARNILGEVVGGDLDHPTFQYRL